MQKLLKASLPMVFIIIPFLAKAQGNILPIARQINALQQYAAQRPIEKVHLQLDRNQYAPGDTIWFKAYTVAGDHHTLSGLSGVLYTELIGIDNKVQQRLIIKLKAGTGTGDFTIAADYKPGNYRIRAYTNWMRNDSSAYFYDRVINITDISSLQNASTKIDTPKIVNSATQPTATKPDVQFFPEGGQLVSGLRSKIAFKALDHNGHSVSINGSVLDEAGNEVAVFETLHNGMGEFPLTPLPGKQYKARITTATGGSYYQTLPPAKDHGFTLTINNAADSIYITVAANEKLYKAGIDTAFYLLATEDGAYYYATGSKLNSPVYSIHIASSRFPTGIARFTLFSQNGEPQCERVIFVQHKDLNLVLNTGKENYSRNGNVAIQLNASDETSNTVAGNFSVAVTNETESPVDEMAEPTIFTDLLLSEELKGNIEEPNYYFARNDDKTRNDLDLLMLTQGYRRFEWQKIMQNAAMQQIEGLVKDSKGLPVADAKVSVVSMADQQVIDTLTDNNGHFVFENTTIIDSARLLIKAQKKDKKDMVIYVLNPNRPYDNNSSYINIDTTRQMVAANGKLVPAAQTTGEIPKKGKVLQEVKVRSVKKEKPGMYNKYGTDAGYIIPSERLKGFSSPRTGLLSTVPGLTVDGHGMLGTFIRGMIVPIGVIVNKTRIDPRNVDEEVNIEDVDYIKIIRYDDFSEKTFYGITYDPFYGKVGDVIVINTRQKPGMNNNPVVRDTVLNEHYFTTTGQPTGSMIYVFRADSTNNNELATFMPEQALSLSGTIQTMKNKPVANGKIKLTAVKDLFSEDTTTDDKGNFTFSGLDFNDTTKVVISTKKISGDNKLNITIKLPVYAEVDEPGKAAGDTIQTMPDSVAKGLKSAYAKGQLSKKTIRLGEEKVEGHRNTNFNPIYSDSMKFPVNLNGPGNAYITKQAVDGLITYNFKGFYKAREFYSPKYASANNQKTNGDDRKTVYWNPYIITDKTGKAYLNYFNNGVPGNYRVVVEGIDVNGNLGRTVVHYKVE